MADHGHDLRFTFGAASMALVVTFVASSAPIPLFNTYRTTLGLTNADISLAVVGYFAGTLLSLLFLGRLSSHLGRKPVSIATLSLLAAGCAVLITVDGLAPIVVGRFLMGLGAGMASSSITAFIVDSAPTKPAWLASVASSQAPNLGLTLGSLGAGALVEFGPWPTKLVYVLAIAWLVICIGLVALSRETLPRTPVDPRSLLPTVQFPARTLPLVPVAGTVFFSTWAMGAFYQAFVPAIVAEQLRTASAFAFALVFCSYMLPNVIGAPLSGRFSPAGAQRVGMALFVVGVATLMVGIVTSSIVVFGIGGLLGGAGQGVAMGGAVRGLLHGSTPAERAPLFAGIYLISYSGPAVATTVSGQLSRTFSLTQIAFGYGALALVATLIVLAFARNPAERP